MSTEEIAKIIAYSGALLALAFAFHYFLKSEKQITEFERELDEKIRKKYKQ